MRYFTLLTIFLLFSSCKKNEVLSDAARIGQEIQATIGSNTDITVTAYTTGKNATDQSQGFVLDGDFVVVDQVHYNLIRLISYRYYPKVVGSQNPALNLYF